MFDAVSDERDGEAGHPYGLVEGISVSAPYGESHIMIKLNALGSAASQNVQVFSSDRTISFDELTAVFTDASALVSVEVTSEEFGVTDLGPMSLFAETGALNVVETDEFGAIIEFDLLTVEGDRIQGRFSYNLK